MYNKPFKKTTKENIFHLAPIPIYKRVYKDCPITENIYHIGKRLLNPTQKLMGQELPGVYDTDRQANYEVNYQS